MDAINSRNIECLKAIFRDDLFIYEPKRINKYISRLNLLLFGNMYCLSCSDYYYIYKYIKRNNIKAIFIGHSALGNLSYYLRKKIQYLHIITFFHNIEKHFLISALKSSNSLKMKVVNYWTCRSEEKTTLCSNILITLNNRDSNLLNQYYSCNSSFELPTSFKDNYSSDKAYNIQSSHKSNSKLKVLFVGVNFFANVNGIKWFIDNVMPEVSDMHLTIVGRDMDKVFQERENISVKGFVDDLDEYYYKTDIVIVPIFEGGGMKTKTAEALMYGCPIISSKEGFEGYDINYNDVGGIFNTPSEAKELLIRYRDNRSLIDKARKHSREFFIKNYTLDSSISKMYKYLNSRNII